MGLPSQRDRPLFRRVAIPLFTLVASIALRGRFTDIICRFRAHKLDILDSPKINVNQAWLERYEVEYCIRFWACSLRVRIKEVPVEIVYAHLEKHRRSKIKPFVGLWSMIRASVFLTLHIKR